MPCKHTTQESNLDFFKTLCLLLPPWNQWAISHLQAAAASEACAHTPAHNSPYRQWAVTTQVIAMGPTFTSLQKAETNMPQAPKNPMVVISRLMSASPALRTVFALLPSALTCFSIWKDSSRNGTCISALWLLLHSIFYSPAPGEGRWATSKGFAWVQVPWDSFLPWLPAGHALFSASLLCCFSTSPES